MFTVTHTATTLNKKMQHRSKTATKTEQASWFKALTLFFPLLFVGGHVWCKFQKLNE